MPNGLLLLNKIKKGDIKAFEKVFKHYYSPLCLYATSITGRTDAAEEVVQELFYNFWKERENINLIHSLKSYLYGAVRNRSLLYLEHLEVRSRYRDAVLSEEQAGPESPQEALEYEELRLAVDQTISRLPERRQLIFRMHRFEGKKYAEIANVLSLSVKTVEAEMTKALHELRQELNRYKT